MFDKLKYALNDLKPKRLRDQILNGTVIFIFGCALGLTGFGLNPENAYQFGGTTLFLGFIILILVIYRRM